MTPFTWGEGFGDLVPGSLQWSDCTLLIDEAFVLHSARVIVINIDRCAPLLIFFQADCVCEAAEWPWQRKQCLPGTSLSAEGTGDPANTAERYCYSVVASLVLQKGKVLLKSRNLEVLLKHFSSFLSYEVIRRCNSTIALGHQNRGILFFYKERTCHSWPGLLVWNWATGLFFPAAVALIPKPFRARPSMWARCCAYVVCHRQILPL